MSTELWFGRDRWELVEGGGYLGWCVDDGLYVRGEGWTWDEGIHLRVYDGPSELNTIPS